MIVAMLVALGPWDIEIPIEGMTAANEPNLVSRLSEHFKAMDCEVAVTIQKGSGRVRLRVECPMAEVRLSDVRKALEGTEWSVKPEAWTLHGRVAFRWSGALPEDRQRALERDLAKHCLVADVMLFGDGKKFEHHAYVRFGEDQKSAAVDLLAVLSKHGVKDAEFFWAKQPPNQPRRAPCGAK